MKEMIFSRFEYSIVLKISLVVSNSFIAILVWFKVNLYYVNKQMNFTNVIKILSCFLVYRVTELMSRPEVYRLWTTLASHIV